MWTFITPQLVTYVFSPSRSGETPLEVLDGTQGNLQVDGFTGYNHVTCPEGRTRSGCWSHVRRYFLKAMKTAPDEARYVLNQRDSLTVFLNDAKISLDNNLSERMLRLIALGRKNFLFVGHDEGGQNLAILQSLVSSCIANDVNPQDYLADVIMRIQDHPQSAIDELLHDVWKPPG